MLKGVETLCKTLNMTEGIKGLESDKPTPIIWVLSLMFVKRTADMLRLKSKDEVRGKEFGKENCEIYAKLLNHYRKKLEIIINSNSSR